MLIHLKIEHLATIEAAELQLSPHLTILTGLSGAGKSVLLGALRLLSGERSDRSKIRPGHDSASVSASFDVRQQPAACAWLQDHNFEVDPACCTIKRVISASGNHSITVGGHAINQTALKALVGCLLHVHGQHQQQSLAKPHNQRALLDAFMDEPARLQKLKDAYQHWLSLKQEQERLQEHTRSPEALELLRFKQHELEEAELDPNEWSGLKDEHDALLRADERDHNVARALDALKHDEEHALLSRIEQLKTWLGPCNDPQSAELLAQATVSLEELALHLEHLQPMDADEQAQRLAQVDARMSLLFQLSRKHRVAPEELPALSERLNAAHEEAEHAEERLAQMEALLAQAHATYMEAAQDVSQAREQHAPRMAEAVNTQLKALGMSGSWITLMCLAHEDSTPRPEGLEQVHMIFHPHEGMPPQPLQKIASGGELSRLSLAIHRSLATQSRIPTLVFDEVDVGISGHTASLVADELHSLGQDAQVLCVTHLPQVAAKGAMHYLIEKEMAGQVPETRVRPLNHTERVQVLADMLGAQKDGSEAAQHAERLLATEA